MKVVWMGTGVTYHPQLGKLVAEKPFELDEVVAKKYIKAGLLKKKIEDRAPVKLKTKMADAGKSAKITREGNDGQSTDR